MEKFNYFPNVWNYLGCNTSCLAPLLPTDSFTPHHVLQVGLPVAEEVNKYFRLHGREGDLDSGAGEVAGVVRHRGSLHLLLSLVHPLVGQLYPEHVHLNNHT